MCVCPTACPVPKAGRRTRCSSAFGTSRCAAWCFGHLFGHQRDGMPSLRRRRDGMQGGLDSGAQQQRDAATSACRFFGCVGAQPPHRLRHQRDGVQVDQTHNHLFGAQRHRRLRRRRDAATSACCLFGCVGVRPAPPAPKRCSTMSRRATDCGAEEMRCRVDQTAVASSL